MDLYNELQKKTQELDFSIKNLRKSGTEYAQAEHDYKIKIAETVFKLKDEGTPATLINLVVYGEREVAKLRYNRDVKEAIYKANLEAINSIKLQLRLIEGQLNREYGTPSQVN